LQFTNVFQTKVKQTTPCPQPTPLFQPEQEKDVYGVAAIPKQIREIESLTVSSFLVK